MANPYIDSGEITSGIQQMPAMSLRHRNLQPEVMDQPDLDAGEHHHAPKHWHASTHKLQPENPMAAHPTAVRNNEDRQEILTRSECSTWRRVAGTFRADLANGPTEGLPVEIAGCDFSPVAIEHARSQASRHNAAVTFFPLDVLANPLPEGYGVICCSLFLHHLDEEQHASRDQDASGRWSTGARK